ncbi:amidohydrolase family protein [Flavimarina sp. Hel_I_48]|uniref:amidohydrolase family protein n=1 Tax=Flavimarina sp. Hel_I_48 TaxID=1392488 RepID=UPI0004DFCCA3|nr:amidohydrolase family protein [Flavimarina sp. Hel_I_48]
MFKKLLLFFLTATILSSCNKREPDYDVAVHNINIVDLKTGKIIPRQSVFINADTIHSIVSTKDLLISLARKSINGTDKYLVPGFWDNHVHFRGGDSLIAENEHLLDLYIANGVTTVRDAGGDLTSSVQQWQKEIASGENVGPTIYTSGPKIDGRRARWPGSLEVFNDKSINKALDSLQALNVDFVKLYDSTISGENYLKTIENAEKRGMITSGHMPSTVTVEETTQAGIDAIEHLYYVLKGCSLEEVEITNAVKDRKLSFWSSLDKVMQTYSDSIAQIEFDRLIAADVYVVPTLYIGHTLSFLDEYDHSYDGYLTNNYIGPGIQKTYDGRIKSALNAKPEFIKMRKKLDSMFIQLTGKLNTAGVGLLAGSDSGAYNSYIYPGFSLHLELKALVDAGLSPLEALRASSQNGARFLKKEIPAIKAGRKADLVIIEGNPLEDIENTQRIYWVFKNGESFSQKSQALLKSN